jgi:cytochrome c oxidase subunit 2
MKGRPVILNLRLNIICCAAVLPGGCGGVQSALAPAGYEAQRMANMFWIMAAGATAVWLGVMLLTVYCVRVRPELHTRRASMWIIVGGGAVVPTAVLTVLLIYGLWPLPALVAPAPEGALRIAVSGEQWWWRVTYFPAGQEPVTLANEVRLPAGESVEFRLDSRDVIHSFWIPSIGGKMDMIPGRVTRLALTPFQTGSFRGACAEYCGTSHAFMTFPVVVMERDEFSRWLAAQAEPARDPEGDVAERGRRVFLASGCNACHTVRGTTADGVIGPDLTHVGSRLSLGARSLPNDVETFRNWIASTETLKPGVLMPPFHMLPVEDLRALAEYLEGLQ